LLKGPQTKLFSKPILQPYWPRLCTASRQSTELCVMPVSEFPKLSRQ